MGDDEKVTGSKTREQLWPQILEIIPGGVVELAADGAIVHANAMALDVLGLSYDRITKRFAQDFEPETVWPDGSPCPASAYPAVLALTTGESNGPTTIGLKRKDGSVRWATFSAIPILNDDASVTGAVVTFLEVTEQMRVDAALRRSDSHLRTILETAPEVIFSTDPAGHILFLNRTVPELKPADIIGLDVRSFVSDATRPAITAAIERCVKLQETVRYEADDPYGRPFEAVVAPVLENGQVVSLTFVCIDVSESRQLRAQLMISDRMASVGTLAVGVAHEINNPLTYVLANLQRLQRRFSQQASESFNGIEEVARTVDQAVEGAERIRRVVRDLGTFAGHRSAADASSNVQDVVETTLRLASHETRFRAEVVANGDAAIFVRAEPSRLGQALLNLIVNAAQAIPEGRAGENSIRIGWQALGNEQVEISVSDTGVGIPADRAARIFEPFFTTKAPGVGTGLGLYISRNIVTTLDGSIDLESEVGKGTTFRVLLPAAARRAKRTSEAPKPEAAAETVRGRVLIIDDEDLVRKVLVNVLEAHEVTACGDGREAVELIIAGNFDVILCDLIMPNFTGMDVFEAVRERRPTACDRFVFMSGGTFTERSQSFRRTVQNTVLGKPFDMDTLLALVASRVVAAQAR